MDSVSSVVTLSVLAVIVAVAGFFIFRRLVKPVNLEEHQGFLDAMLSIVGTLVSILLGLIVAAALDHYQATEQNVDAEAASVAQTYRLTVGLPDEPRHQIQKLCADYCKQVVHDEWPLLAERKSSEKVSLIYVQLFATVNSFKPANDGESNIHNALIESVQQIGDARRQRMLVLHSRWTEHLMPMLIMCSAIVLAFTYLYVSKGAILHAIVIACVAVALGGNLGLVLVLSNPFAGEWRIEPRGFLLNAQLLKNSRENPDIKKLLKEE